MDHTNKIWAAIEEGLRKSNLTFSIDGDHKSSEIIVTVEGYDYLIEIAPINKRGF